MTGTCSTEQLEYPDQVESWAALRLGAPGAQRVECSSGAGAGVGVGAAEPVEWVRWKMARLGLAWLDLRLAALPDTLFKFLLVSNQPQPARQPSQPEQRPCTPLGMPPILRAATSCSPWLCRQTADCFQFVAQSAVQSICQRHHECQGLVPTHSRFWGWAPATVPAAPPRLSAAYEPWSGFRKVYFCTTLGCLSLSRALNGDEQKKN